MGKVWESVPHFQPLPHTVTDHKLDGGNKALAKPARPLILFPDSIFSHFQMRLVGSSPVMLHASIASDDNCGGGLAVKQMDVSVHQLLWSLMDSSSFF